MGIAKSLQRGTALQSDPLHWPGFLQQLNESAKQRVLALQSYFTLAWNSIRFIFARPFYGGDLVQQMVGVGVPSLGIVLLSGFFTGMLLALQSSLQLPEFVVLSY